MMAVRESAKPGGNGRAEMSEKGYGRKNQSLGTDIQSMHQMG